MLTVYLQKHLQLREVIIAYLLSSAKLKITLISMYFDFRLYIHKGLKFFEVTCRPTYVSKFLTILSSYCLVAFHIDFELLNSRGIMSITATRNWSILVTIKYNSESRPDSKNCMDFVSFVCFYSLRFAIPGVYRILIKGPHWLNRCKGI